MSTKFIFLKSFVDEQVISSYNSPLNGKLEVTWNWGKKVLQAENANYSFQQLHRVWRKAIRQAKIREFEINRILNLGMGGGSTVHILRKELRIESEIISVEHDPIIIEIAKEHFGINAYRNHKIICEDAFEFSRNCQIQFDLILCDLFKNDLVPEKILSEGFFQNLVNLLNPNGKLIFNYMNRPDLSNYWNAVLKFFDTQSGRYKVIKLFSENETLIYFENGNVT